MLIDDICQMAHFTICPHSDINLFWGIPEVQLICGSLESIKTCVEILIIVVSPYFQQIIEMWDEQPIKSSNLKSNHTKTIQDIFF